MVETEVMVASAGQNLLSERMKLCSMLWDANIKAEMAYKENPRLLNQFEYCEKAGVPFQVLVGEEELKADSLKVRDAETREEVSCGSQRRNVLQSLLLILLHICSRSVRPISTK